MVNVLPSFIENFAVLTQPQPTPYHPTKYPGMAYEKDLRRGGTLSYIADTDWLSFRFTISDTLTRAQARRIVHSRQQ